MQFSDHCLNCFIRKRLNLISEASASIFILIILDFWVNFTAKISTDQRCNILTKKKKGMLEERNIITGQEV